MTGMTTWRSWLPAASSAGQHVQRAVVRDGAAGLQTGGTSSTAGPHRMHIIAMHCAMFIAPQLRPDPTHLSRAAAAAPPAAAAPRCGGAGGAAPTACPPRKPRSARCTPPLRGWQGAEGVSRGMCGRVEREQQPGRQPGKGGHAQLPTSPLSKSNRHSQTMTSTWVLTPLLPLSRRLGRLAAAAARAARLWKLQL